jgi:uncharacterized protein
LSDSENNPPLHGPLDGSIVRDFTSSASDVTPSAAIASETAAPTLASHVQFIPPSHLPPEQRYSHLPPTLRVPWGWLDLFLIVVLSFVAVMVLVFGGSIIYAALGHDPRSLNPASPAMLYIAVILQGILDAGVLVLMLALVRFRYHRPAWAALGWRRLPDTQMSRGAGVLALIASGVVLSFVVAAASQLFPPKKELPVEQILQDHRTAILFMLMAVLIAPVVEETFFRGFLYPVAARSFGVPAGIIVTGTLFGLLHASQLSGGPWLIFLIVVVGIVFTWIRVKADTVLASFIVHTAYNGVQVVGLLIATHGLTKVLPHT